MDAILLQDFDESKISYGFLKRQTQGSVVSVYYNDSFLTLQTPLMNTFGISEMEGKWSMNLIFSESNGVNSADIALFKDVLNRLRQKVVNDIVSKKLYVEWMGIKDKWNNHSEELKRELVSQMIGSEFLKHSKKDVEKKYPPTMGLKVHRNRDTQEFNMSVFKALDNNQFECNEDMEPIDFRADIMNLLHFQGQDVKVRPKVYCLVCFNIWIINNSLYITPSCNSVCLTPVKVYNNRARFNVRGFTHQIVESSEIFHPGKLSPEYVPSESFDDAEESKSKKHKDLRSEYVKPASTDPCSSIQVQCSSSLGSGQQQQRRQYNEQTTHSRQSPEHREHAEDMGDLEDQDDEPVRHHPGKSEFVLDDDQKISEDGRKRPIRPTLFRTTGRSNSSSTLPPEL